MQQLDLLLLRRPVVDLLAVPAADQEAALHQGAQVVGYRRGGHLKHGGDVDHAFLRVAEQPENANPGRVAQLRENVGHGGKMGLIAQFCIELGQTAALAVVVWQRRLRHKNSSNFYFGHIPRLFGKTRRTSLAF